MTMQLSEAIRLGAMLKPQGFGGLETRGKTCALGAAYDATGLLGEGVTFEDAEAEFPLLGRSGDINCPACPAVMDRSPAMTSLIAHLNDAHRWTRERIADWVATIEAPQAEPVNEPIAALVTA